MRDGLYRVVRCSMVAGFILKNGKVIRSAPILHKNIHYWMKQATWIAE